MAGSAREKLVPFVAVVLLVLRLGVPHEDAGVTALDGTAVTPFTAVALPDLFGSHVLGVGVDRRVVADLRLLGAGEALEPKVDPVVGAIEVLACRADGRAHGPRAITLHGLGVAARRPFLTYLHHGRPPSVSDPHLVRRHEVDELAEGLPERAEVALLLLLLEEEDDGE